MGGTVSSSRVTNKSKYLVVHEAHFANNYRSKTLGPEMMHRFPDKGKIVHHKLIVYDRKNRLIKQLEFESFKDYAWEIHREGVRLVQRGSKAILRGDSVVTEKNIAWNIDLEEKFRNEDAEKENKKLED